MTVAFPLSAGNIVMFLSALRLFIACFSMYVKLLHGGLDFFKILPTSPLISSAATAGRFLIPDSTWAIMSSVGIFLGVTLKV